MPQSREEVQLSFSPVVKRVAGSVVNVYGSQTARQVQSPFAGDPFFERFFGQQPQRRRGQTSLGSGVVVTKDGTILTNNHVIANMDVVKIALADGREFDCDIVLSDERPTWPCSRSRTRTRASSRSRSATATRWRSAIWCWPSEIPSASARP